MKALSGLRKARGLIESAHQYEERMVKRLSIPAELKTLFPELDQALINLSQLDTVDWRSCPRGVQRFQPKFETLSSDAKRRITLFAKVHDVSQSSVVTTALSTFKGLAKV